MPTRAYADMAAEVVCAVCDTVETIDERHEVIPNAWRMDTDRRVYCPRCIRAHVRPDIESRSRWSR